MNDIKINSYVVASTGNIGVAFSRYLSAANISLHAFIPKKSALIHAAEISCFGQKVYRTDGDYANCKQIALDFSKINNIHLSPNGYDPIRIEAKKTIGYEWYNNLKEFPTVYIQALSGGTGPIGIHKSCSELKKFNLINKIPRFILVQADGCDPMAQSWELAKKNGFQPNWQHQYIINKNPKTNIPTLATGNPVLYPIISNIVKDTKGEILSFSEKLNFDVAKFVAYQEAVRIGPAAAVAVGGFFKAIKCGLLNNNDIIIISIGEGIRRSPEFMNDSKKELKPVNNFDDCSVFDRSIHCKNYFNQFEKIISQS